MIPLPRLLLPFDDDDEFGIVGVRLADDSIRLSDAEVDAKGDDESGKANFTAKPKTYLAIDDPLLLNVGVVPMDALTRHDSKVSNSPPDQ
ncbi:hypothetical protein CH35J_012889 [Colletotrichum higginsianum]|uniref:Uncharacterized protein n=1 Tax=Colletotrichum higginsianum TaxID=80884 RepID=A0A4V4N9S0_9PEZI|nr:hypothetical protein CH35J_012889 [Colletotrichum higginsianum]